MISDQPSALDTSRANAPASRSFRSLKLAWTDADSGEQFILSVRGGARLLGGLQKAGFELVGEDAALPDPRAGLSAGPRSAQRRPN